METLIESVPDSVLTILRVAAFVIGVYLFLIWIASLFWAYRDMRSRTRDLVTQLAGVSVLVFLPLLGYPVYLAVRPSLTLREAYDRDLEQEAILSELQSAPTCPECRRPIDREWMICAFCSHALKQPCQGCERLLMNAWRHCPYCAEPRVRPEPAEAMMAAAAAEETPARRRVASRTAGQPAQPGELIRPVSRPRRPAFGAEAEPEPAGGTLRGPASGQA